MGAQVGLDAGIPPERWMLNTRFLQYGTAVYLSVHTCTHLYTSVYTFLLSREYCGTISVHKRIQVCTLVYDIYNCLVEEYVLTTQTSTQRGTQTILDLLITNQEAKENDPSARVVFGLTSRVRIGTQDNIISVGVDNGNDALKLAVINDGGELVTLRVPMSYRTAKSIQAGEGELTYRMGRTAFWTGETALRHEGGDIPAGPTDQRVIDNRWARSLASGLVELLTIAHFSPGAYQVALGFAIPNNEIVRNTDTNKLGVANGTAEALKEHVRSKVWGVQRIDKAGSTEDWTITVREVVPQAQSLGTYTVWSKATTGKTVTDVDGVVVIDIGGGDLQVTEIALNPYQMITERVGDGTISIARALIDQFPDLKLTSVAAQQGLMTRRMMIGGKYRDVDEEVLEVLGSEGQNIIGQVLPILRQSKRFVIVTGGGVILLYDMLTKRLDTAQKTRGEHYELINHGLASILNSVGALFAMLFKAHRQQRGS